MSMNKKERERLKVMIRLQDKSITQKIAAEQLSVGIRQVQRLLKAYRTHGERGLISLKRGKISNNKLHHSIREKVPLVILKHYHDFRPTFAHEKLTEIHKMKLSVSSVRNIMIENGIWKPKKDKQIKVYQRRNARDCIGELIQADGSYHDWFEGRAPECCLIVLIDDATSRIMWLQFVKWESCFGYFEALKAYIKKYGLPLSVYTDRLAVFETTRKSEKNYKSTQFNRALSSLGINLILANSPQAKGRVERVNETLQDRLIKEMRLAHISSMEEGNAFLPSYIKMHNKKFAKRPKSPINAHKTLDPEVNLERILCLHFERRITKDLLISFKRKTYQIIEPAYKHRLGKQKVLVIEKEGGKIEFVHKGRVLEFKRYQDLPRESDFGEKKITPIANIDPSIADVDLKGHWHPDRKHPWRIWRKRLAS